MIKMILGRGNISVGEDDQLWVPDKVDTSQAGVLLLHGATAGGTPNEIDGPGWLTISRLIYRLCEAGIPCVAGLMGGNTYANDAISGVLATNFCNKALSYMSGVTGCRSGKAHAFGLSMGAGVGIRWAGMNPLKVASVVGGIPMTDMGRFYDNATIGGVDFRTGIQTAWGITHPTPLPATAQLIATQAPVLAGNNIPNMMFYTTDDPYVLPADVVNYAAAAGGTAISLGTGGHTAAAVAKMEDWNNGDDWSSLVNYFKAVGDNV